MQNPYQQYRAKIILKNIWTKNTNVFKIVFEEKNKQKNFMFIPGQFMLVGLPGFGEAPFDICSAPVNAQDYFQIAVRSVGELTRKINSAKAKDTLFVRGPFGNGFPDFKGKDNLLMIGGGCGVVTFRSFVENEMQNPKMYGKLQLLYGVGKEEDLYFQKDYKKYKNAIDLHIIINKPKKTWKGHKGVITDLFGKIKLIENPKVLMCGPPIMYKFVIQKLLPMGILPKNIFLSLERRMYCGMGICQHCAIGSKYVCKDGPVFSYEDLLDKEKYKM